MKKTYSAPVMYREAYEMDQYIAASDCGIILHQTPDHGHFSNNTGEIHCAFTSSNCGSNATGCETSTGGACNSFKSSMHQVVTQESGSVINKPISGYHNCHILSDNTAAKSFVDNYDDKKCAQGVAALMGLSNFEDIEKAFS